MRVLIDTNIIISTVLFPNSITAEAYLKAVSDPYNGAICDWTIDELQRVFNRKFSNKTDALMRFLANLSMYFEIIPTPEEKVLDEVKIRDEKDRPILRAAQISKVDYLLTGDKDFLDSEILDPIIISPSDFIKL